MHCSHFTVAHDVKGAVSFTAQCFCGSFVVASHDPPRAPPQYDKPLLTTLPPFPFGFHISAEDRLYRQQAERTHLGDNVGVLAATYTINRYANAAWTAVYLQHKIMSDKVGVWQTFVEACALQTTLEPSPWRAGTALMDRNCQSLTSVLMLSKVMTSWCRVCCLTLKQREMLCLTGARETLTPCWTAAPRST